MLPFVVVRCLVLLLLTSDFLYFVETLNIIRLRINHRDCFADGCSMCNELT